MNDPVDADYLRVTREYAGWGQSVNGLAAHVFAHDPACDWIVGGGDDTEPDPTKLAEEIARECSLHFGHDPDDAGDPEPVESTFGVMQATGDRWGADEPWARAAFPDAPAYIDRICGSPWIGREFARRMNQGAGAVPPRLSPYVRGRGTPVRCATVSSVACGSVET